MDGSVSISKQACGYYVGMFSRILRVYLTVHFFPSVNELLYVNDLACIVNLGHGCE